VHYVQLLFGSYHFTSGLNYKYITKIIYDHEGTLQYFAAYLTVVIYRSSEGYRYGYTTRALSYRQLQLTLLGPN
jgi:hypothetical protein